jgi:hypothetical protein
MSYVSIKNKPNGGMLRICDQVLTGLGYVLM